MKKHMQFSINLSKVEAEQLVKDYYAYQGYYELMSDVGLKFTISPKSTEVLNPNRLFHQIQVMVEEHVNKTLIKQEIRVKRGGSFLFTPLDHQYFNNLERHFKAGHKKSTNPKVRFFY